MGVYGDQIERLKLVREIAKSTGRDELPESDVIQLHAMVLSVADQVGDLLAAIPMTFKQYTKHDLLHARNLIDLMGRFIPAKTLKKLNGIELTVLVLVAMLHDFGMYVEEEEKQNIVDGEEFNKLLDAMPEKKQAIIDANEAGRPYAASAIRDAVLADYFRKLHPERARQNIQKYLTGVLRFREYDLTSDIATICASHGWGVFETTDPRHPERTIDKLKTSDPIYGVPFNPQYAAACLRLADIMDFDRSRTPLALLRTVTDAKSVSEWRKHLQIKGWTITDRDVSFNAKCTHPEHYVAVMEFLDWIDIELRDSRRLRRKQPKATPEHYMLNLPTTVDRFDVEMAEPSYVAGAFRFELDYERIMKILMDKSLYPDPSLFLRELLQNSLDACRVRMAMAQSEGASEAYTPQITVWDNSKEEDAPTIVFQDNGIGMSKSIIEKYFMLVGRSYYRSTEFEIERKRLSDLGIDLEATSQFGIGFLSCFMVSDRVEIETYRQGSEALHVTIEGPTKYFTIRIVESPNRSQFRAQGATPDDDRPPAYPGTRITVYLRGDQPISVNDTLERFSANIDVPVMIHGEITTSISAWKWETTNFAVTDIRTPLPERFLESFSAISNVITPMFVPLERYDFCEGFSGRFWFWMLRSLNGEPSPRRGHLIIDAELRTAGIVNIASRVRSSVNADSIRLIDSNGLPSTGENAFVRTEFNRQWRQLTSEERAGISEWLTKHTLESWRLPKWHSTEDAVLSLAAGDDTWLNLERDFHDSLDIYAPAEYALHGILLPAGITAWNPMTGTGNRLRIFQGAGYRLDMRKNAPVPAANRLFWSASEGFAIATPVFRACLRFVLEIADQHAGDLDWGAWVDSMLGDLSYFDGEDYWARAMIQEKDLIRSVLKLLVVDENGSTVELSVDDTRNRYGRWVPMNDELGIKYSVQSRMLLFGHPTRIVEHRVEVDLLVDDEYEE